MKKVPITISVLQMTKLGHKEVKFIGLKQSSQRKCHSSISVSLASPTLRAQFNHTEEEWNLQT